MGSKETKAVKEDPTKLTEEDIELLLKNTHFCREQIQEWHTGFIVFNLISVLMIRLEKFYYKL